MKKSYDFYLKYIKHTNYVPLSYDDFGDMLTTLDYIIIKNETEIEGLLVYYEKDYVDINLILGKTSTFRPMLEQLLTKTKKDLRIHYQKPYPLAWYANENMIHPNYQGVIVDSTLHKVLLDFGFKDTSIQDTYYMNLKTFKMDRTIHERLEALNNQGYDVTLYNPSKHTHMTYFLDNLLSKSFKTAIENNLKKQKPDPLLIVTKDHRVMGFAGPLFIADDFRGVFSGIEILSDVRNLGLGKILFQHLCFTLKKMGARYMTLFTGRNNVAKFIYLQSGFKVAESFSLMLYERN